MIDQAVASWTNNAQVVIKAIKGVETEIKVDRIDQKGQRDPTGTREAEEAMRDNIDPN